MRTHAQTGHAVLRSVRGSGGGLSVADIAPAEQNHAGIDGDYGDLRAAGFAVGDLRHELRQHAGTAFGKWLLHSDWRDAVGGDNPVAVFPPQGLAVTPELP